MSTALAYPEPYRFSAGVLALVVHLLFFAVLYFGVHWQSRTPESFVVQMWDNLPDTEAVPERAPPPPAKMEPKQPPKVVAPTLPPAKADIELRDKKSKKAEAKQKPDKKKDAKEKAAAKAKLEADEKELEAYDRNKIVAKMQQFQAEQARIHAEVEAANRTQIESYRDKIVNKIRHKRKEVADVPASAEAIFKVTLLPDGTLMDDPVLVKSSGYPAYDDAAERAILAAQPLPVPPDLTLQKLFRELKLSIRP
jgi:colicin import membrane protein